MGKIGLFFLCLKQGRVSCPITMQQFWKFGLMFSLLLTVFTVKAQVPLELDLSDSIENEIDTSTLKAGSKKVPLRIKQAGAAYSPKSSRGNTRIDSLVHFAEQYMGNRYRRGGTTSAGFDCSGYTMTVFKHLGIKLPHTSAGQALIGIPVSAGNMQKGDLILFRGGNRRRSRIGHVGIVISEKGEPVRFIHSSTSDGVRIDNLSGPYFRNRFVKAVRIPELYQ
jgi:cell wall-associated NlpC family hydrolase